MRIDEICSHRIVHIRATATLQQAARLMRDESTRALLVTEHTAVGARVVGIVTDRDMVVHGIASRSDCTETAVSEVMTRGLLTIRDDAVISEALRLMLSHGLHRLGVVDRQQRLVGMLSLDDTIRAMGGEWTLLVGILGRDNFTGAGPRAPSDLIL
ncbi:MAG: CBS domain-containing protein [Pseudomonadota bacterium]|uniref:CBS domain-containing protein n=1 Tax=Ralstonia pickettii TaxID=329 RepID=A0A7X2HK25_RALPI|nr:CBS domain-containing protein [Ralstonia pickettii]MEE2979415.1 CBS domain-containing protein [Pseudomonadota bacterium]MRS97973.1 CBS domain-containing protein [Ralstonia pickettii]NWK44539.1 CBS domain-containing protein [Ralstonia pickettii]WKZ88364.1 CBS domain-containing protein [Ralstonia pickettii]